MSHFNPTRVGPYRLLGTVGGGARSVERARDAGGRRVVLKRHARDEEPGGLAEAAFLGLAHPGVAACLDAGRVPGTGELFTVTPEVEGEPFGPGAVRADPAARRLVAARLLSAVGVIHGLGLLHRDLKDDNVLLERRTGRPVVIDLGLACAETEVASLPLAGTPRGMAPELFTGDTASRASDLWGAGLVLAEAFTGRRLFEGREPAAMAEERAAWTGLGEDDARRVGDRALTALLDRLLDPSPARRPQDAEAALAAIPLDDGAARELQREALVARLGATLAADDPWRARRLAALASGRLPVHLAPDGPFDAWRARDALLGWIAALPDPDEGLRARLADPTPFPVDARELAWLVERLAASVPLVLAVPPAGDDAEAAARCAEFVDACRLVPRVELHHEAPPTGEEAAAACAAWLGARPELEERLAASPPARRTELHGALAELVRAGVVVPGPAGLTVDSSRLPPGWPLADDADPTADLDAAAREVVGLVALAPRSVTASTLRDVLGEGAPDALRDATGAGFLRRLPSSSEDRYAPADEPLRRRVLATAAPPLAAPPPAARARLACRLAEERDAAEDDAPLAEPEAAGLAQLLGDAADGDDPPGTTALALRLATTFRKLGLHDRAAAVLRRGLAGCAPGDADRTALQRELVDVLTRATRLDEAREALGAARAEAPDAWTLVLAEARLDELSGRVEEGLAKLAGLEDAALDRDDAALGFQIRSDLLRRLGRFEDAARDLRDGLRALGDVVTLRALTLRQRLATIESRLGRPTEAIRLHERCLSLAGELGLDVHRFSITFNLGRAVWNRGERRRGLALQEEAVRLCETYGQQYGLVTLLFGVGSANLALGRVDAARRAFDRALRLARARGDEVEVARALNNLAMALAAEGRADEAEASWAESLRIRRDKGDVVGQAAVVLARGGSRLDRGDDEGARADLDEARRCAEERDGRGWAAESALLEAGLALRAGERGAAATAADRALAVATERAVDLERLRALALLGEAGAADLEDEDLAGRERTPEVARVALARAGRRADAGRVEEARADLDLALAVLGETPSGPVEARVLLARLALDLVRLEDEQRKREPDYAIIGDLVSRVVPDAGRARELVDRFGLRPLEETLAPMEAAVAAMDDHTESNGLGALARRLRDFERLMEINKLLNTERDTQKLLDLIVDSAIELTGATRGFIILFEGQAEEFRAARNFDESTIRDPQFQVSHSVAKRVAREGEPLLTANAIDDPRLASATSITELQLLSILCVPLRSRERSFGALYLDHPQVVGRFEASHLATVTSLSEQAAIALENARLSYGLEESNRELLSSREEVSRLNEALQERLEAREAELEQTKESLEHSQRALALRYDYGNIVTRSPRMHAVLDMMDRVTDTDFAVVIYGESGTGKELMARAIHFNGARRDKNFLTLNCAALPDSLIESELFGHVRGAFTGAERDRKGLFEQAHGGTLFLDEIGDMSLDVQKRLLRVLQESEFIPVGGREVRSVDVRILCATHRDLSAMKETGGFREDLFYRLDVARIELPPLRERPEDVALLVPHFLERHGARSLTVEPEGLAILEQRPWPGNVRELENFVMTLLLFAKEHERIDADLVRRVLSVRDAEADIPAPTTPAADEGDRPLKARLEAFERQAIREALERTGGNKAQAARELGVGVRSLYKMIERLDI